MRRACGFSEVRVEVTEGGEARAGVRELGA